MKTKMPDKKLVQRARRALSRLARFTNRLQRTQLACGPVTVQQCHTLEALMQGPLPMNKLADEVALHQSTLTRVVEKLEEKNLLVRRRPAKNQRMVEVTITDEGKNLYAQLDEASNAMIGKIFSFIGVEERANAVRGLELICHLLDPQNAEVQQIITGCGCDQDSSDG